MKRILIVDDHPIVRDGLKQILGDTDDLVVGGEAGNADERSLSSGIRTSISWCSTSPFRGGPESTFSATCGGRGPHCLY